MLVNEIIAEIKDNHTQVSSSQKDEIRIMQGMLNDKSYEVGVYAKDGKVGTYSPSQDFRKMQGSVISQVAKISKSEADDLLDAYEYTKSDAATMVNVSKEFVNTYLDTNRKLLLGGREKSNFSLVGKLVPDTTKTYQKKITSSDGIVTWEPGKKHIPEHAGIKAKGSCPVWVK